MSIARGHNKGELLKPPKFKSPTSYSGNSFGGILLEPIMTKIAPRPLGTDPLQDEAIEKLATEVRDKANDDLAKRITALAEHYKISLVDLEYEAVLFKIVVCLGRDFLPGFQLNMGRPQTRPCNSHQIGGPKLFETVNSRRDTQGETVKQACTYLNRHGPVKIRNAGVKELEAAYYSFKKSISDAEAYFNNDDFYAEVIRVMGFEGFVKQAQEIV